MLLIFPYSAQILLGNVWFCRQNARLKNRLFWSKFYRQNLSKPITVFTVAVFLQRWWNKYSSNSLDVIFSLVFISSMPSNVRGEEQGSKSPSSLLSEPISPSSLLFEPISPSSLNVYLTFSPSSLLFPLFLPLPNLFWAISPSSLFCSSPLQCEQ